MAESELVRTHPATVISRSLSTLWQTGVGLFFALIASGATRSAPLLGLAALALLAGVVGIGLSWLAWSRFGYGIEGSDLVVVSGLWVRKRRVIPIARVHGVNVRADLFMRMLGLVEVVVQTAGGGATEPEAKIGAITLADAEVLRSKLLRTPSRDVDPQSTPAASEEQAATLGPAVVGADPVGRMSDFRGAFGGREEHREDSSFEHAVGMRELALAAITSSRVPVMFVVMLGVSAQLVEVVGVSIFQDTASAATQLAIPALLGVALAAIALVAGAAVIAAVIRDYGFVARRVGQRVELEAGLLEKRMTGIPVRRVQAVRVNESFMRKLFGLAVVYVDTAGISHEQQASGGSTAMVPVVRTRELASVMHGLLPEAETFPISPGLPLRALRFYILVPTLLTIAAGTPLVVALGFLWAPGYVAGSTVLALIATIVASGRAFAWRAAGIGVDERAMTMQSGVLGRNRMRISKERIQSLSVTQNLFQRRADLATIVADSVSGASKARHRVSHIEAKRALRLMRWYEDGADTRA